MTDTNLESGSTPATDAELPVPQFTGTSDKPTSDDLTERISKVVSDQLGAFERRLQSQKDRGVNRVEKELEQVKDRLGMGVLDEYEELIRQGKTPQDARQTLVIRDLQQRVYGSPAEQKPIGGTVDPAMVRAVANTILAEAKVDRNDPDVQNVLTKVYGTPEQFYAELTRVAVSKASKPQPTPAGVVPPSSSGIAPMSEEAMIEEYTKEMNAARGNAALVKATIEKHRKKGVPVDRVVFH